jgi:hypothetical protein
VYGITWPRHEGKAGMVSAFYSGTAFSFFSQDLNQIQEKDRELSGSFREFMKSSLSPLHDSIAFDFSTLSIEFKDILLLSLRSSFQLNQSLPDGRKFISPLQLFLGESNTLSSTSFISGQQFKVPSYLFNNSTTLPASLPSHLVYLSNQSLELSSPILFKAFRDHFLQFLIKFLPSYAVPVFYRLRFQRPNISNSVSLNDDLVTKFEEHLKSHLPSTMHALDVHTLSKDLLTLHYNEATSSSIAKTETLKFRKNVFSSQGYDRNLIFQTAKLSTVDAWLSLFNERGCAQSKQMVSELFDSFSLQTKCDVNDWFYYDEMYWWVGGLLGKTTIEKKMNEFYSHGKGSSSVTSLSDYRSDNFALSELFSVPNEDVCKGIMEGLPQYSSNIVKSIASDI